MMQQFFAFTTRTHKNQMKKCVFFTSESRKIRFLWILMLQQPTHTQTHINKYAHEEFHSFSMLLPANSCSNRLESDESQKKTVNIEKMEMIPPKELHTAFCCQQTFAKYDLITESNQTWQTNIETYFAIFFSNHSNSTNFHMQNDDFRDSNKKYYLNFETKNFKKILY